jgi:hypothetical protein
MSSSAPGASPTNISSACGLPTPKTICLRPCSWSLQRVQSPMSLRISRSRMPLAFVVTGIACVSTEMEGSSIASTGAATTSAGI